MAKRNQKSKRAKRNKKGGEKNERSPVKKADLKQRPQSQGKKTVTEKRAQPPAKRRPPDKKAEGPRGAAVWVKKTGQFLREARVELKKVKWPTRKELFASTAVVIILVLIVAFYLGLVDFGLIKIIKAIVG